jgi:hypothetical protein
MLASVCRDRGGTAFIGDAIGQNDVIIPMRHGQGESLL